MSPRATLYCGDALEVLRTVPSGSPYWRQRDYGLGVLPAGGQPLSSLAQRAFQIRPL